MSDKLSKMTYRSPFCCSWCECNKGIERPLGRMECGGCGNLYTWGGLGEWVLIKTGASWEEEEEDWEGGE